MSGWTLVSIIVVYTVPACLITLIWARIPPRDFMSELMIGVIWPISLSWLVLRAFINSTVRALTDQDGRFAGLYKNRELLERIQRQERRS